MGAATSSEDEGVSGVYEVEGGPYEEGGLGPYQSESRLGPVHSGKIATTREEAMEQITGTRLRTQVTFRDIEFIFLLTFFQGLCPCPS